MSQRALDSAGERVVGLVVQLDLQLVYFWEFALVSLLAGCATRARESGSKCTSNLNVAEVLCKLYEAYQ